MKYLAVLLITILLAPTYLYAATDNFIIKTQVGADTEAPSIVTGLVASAISPSQIDISWNASTDNLGVAGYQIFRDSVQIATSTLLNYSDTGLVSSTTYSYEVVAFDDTGNLSATSTAALATTDSIVIIVDTDEGKSQSTRVKEKQFEIFDWQVVSGVNQITITFSTDQYVRSAIRWGRTSSYELGYSEGNTLRKEHTIKVTDLNPDTIYEFNLRLNGIRATDSLEKSFQIKTNKGPDVLAPANVTNLKATYIESEVLLTWKNPKDMDFSKVRIVRNEKFYPTDVADGWTIYEGGRESVEDFLQDKDGIYYTVFSIDNSGNISSGAVVYAGKVPREDIVVDTEIDPLKENEAGIKFADIIFKQNNEVIVLDQNNNLNLSSDTLTNISIPYDALPEHLKAIVVTLVHPYDKSLEFSFLLKVNSDKTNYEATIGALENAGLYKVKVDVYDFKTKKMFRLSGSAQFDSTKMEVPEKTLFIMWLPIFLIMLVLLLSLFVYYRKAEDSRV